MLLIAVLLLGLLTADAEQDTPARVQEPVQLREGVFEKTIERRVALRYLLYLPRDYGQRDVSWPMILYLHGGMGRGDDFEKMSWYPLPRMLREPGHDFPFIALMPQCPENDIWDSEALHALVDEVSASYAIDPDRIYLVGYSMGGTGAWRLALAYPERFAAAAPMSGYADPARAARLKGVPVWVFHGAKDDRVPPNESEKMVAALEAAGADVRFSLDPERGHSPPSDEEHMRLFEWLLTYRRGAVQPPGDGAKP